MPYFKNKDINLLFVHIPKTGGSSVESYFSYKYNIPGNYKSLWSANEEDIKKLNSKCSLQHLTLNQIYKYYNEKLIDLDLNNLKIITIVRNPYERIISGLFWHSLIKKDSTKEEVFEIIKNYIKSSDYNNLNIPQYLYDNHNIPQYLFITDDNKNIFNNVEIFYTKTLDDDMKRHGYSDFSLRENCNKVNVNYYDYLNQDSIDLINSFYHDDFVLFKFNKI
jgi:hypothetical protein